MNRNKVAILGCTGMLGAITLDAFVRSGDFELVASCRDKDESAKFIANYPSVEFRTLDAQNANMEDIEGLIKGVGWVVNAIGIIKPYIHDDNPEEVERAIRVNSLFPHLLGRAAQKTNAKAIQIATDCVYSGEKGKYTETDMHDALDVYGKTKSLGEAYLNSVAHIRCSIIGPELKSHLSLMDWFLGQENKATVNGFTNHQWNGVTTLHFARLCMGMIKEDISIDHVQHIIPGSTITKADLLKSFAKEFGREDIIVNSVEAPKVIDRTLTTSDDDLNSKMWKAAGYVTPPTIEQMVTELAEYGFSSKDN